MFNWRELYDNLSVRISEQAYSKQKAEDILTSEMDPLTEHLIKILKWKDSYNNPKHVRDINNQWLKRVQKAVVSSSIKMKLKQLKRIVVDESMSTFNISIAALNDEYDINYNGYLIAYRTDEEVKYELERILIELAIQLSNLTKDSKPISISGILQKLKIDIYGM